MMATECRKMSTMRKQIVRQNAVSKCPDLTLELEETKRQPSDQACSVGYIEDSKQWSTKQKITIQTYIPESKDSQVTSSTDKMNHNPKCQETHYQGQGLTAASEKLQNVELSRTKIPSIRKEQLLNCCNKKLESYGNLLLRRRNTEKIYFHLGTSLKKNASLQQDYKRVARKKDVSDGVPDSSGVLTETSSLKNNQDVLTGEQKHSQKPNGHGLLDVHVHVSQELKKSPRRSSLDSLSVDEGFVNGDAKRCASLSSALNDIPEDGACALPILKLNDHEKSLSLTGQEKGEVFRNSKRSSGYGTGGSEEAPPEDECFSSVFERSLSNNDAKPASETQLHLSYKPLSNTGGLLTENGTELPDEIGEASVSPSSNGLRIVDLKESSLPNDACIWNLQDLHIKSHIRRKYMYKDGVTSSLNPSEPGNDFVEIMRDNPQIPLPILNSDDFTEGIYHDEKSGNEEIGNLRSHDSYYDDHVLADCQLLISNASVPSLAHSGIIHDGQVNGYMDCVDAVDGARCLTQGAKLTSALKQNTNNNITQRQKKFFGKDQSLERAVFCKKLRCVDPMCLEGRIHVLQLQKLIERGRLQDCDPKIFELLWRHSKNCTECHCMLPLCHSFRQRPLLSLEEHKRWMTEQSLKEQLSNELGVSIQTVLQNGTFLTMNDEGADDHTFSKTAEVECFCLIGDFCDFNILHVRMRYNKMSGASVDVVVKKTLQAGPNEKNVYLAIKKPSPYLVKNYWYSELPNDALLVCSVYHEDLMDLQAFRYRDVTPDGCLEILRQAALAAQYLHSLNVVYLSWKCSGLLIDEENQSVKLCNFSHAVVLEQGVVVRSPDSVRSSIDPCFAAPEVLRGEPLGFYSDVWGLACLLYEMLHISKPYPDFCHHSPADIRQMVCRNEKIYHTYPDDQQLQNILCNCWEREAAQRIAMDKLLLDLKLPDLSR